MIMGKVEKMNTEEHRLAEWEKMFREAESLKTNMKFYSSEMAFLRSLMDRYMLWLVEEESLSGLKLLSSKIKNTDDQCNNFVSQSESLMNRLGLLIENPFSQDEHKISESFKRTLDEAIAFESEIKRLKSEIFDHVAHTLRTEKARRLLAVH